MTRVLKFFMLGVFCLVLIVLTWGREGGFLTAQVYDPVSGQKRTIVYSPAFMSNIALIDQDFVMAVTVANEKKINLLYSLAMRFGLLGQDDLFAPATLVIHLQNQSEQDKNILLHSLTIFNKKYDLPFSAIIIGPHQKTQTSQIGIEIPNFDTEIKAIIVYAYASQTYEENFVLKRRTTEEMQEGKLGESK